MIPIGVITHLPMMHSYALGMVATFVVRLSLALLGALRPILLYASLHRAGSNIGLAVALLAMRSQCRLASGGLFILVLGLERSLCLTTSISI